MVDFVLNNFTTDRVYTKEFFRKIIETAAKEIGLASKKTELSINLVGEGRIKALNKKYRGRNRVTDVLSFPLQTEVDIAKSRKDATIALGDIFICLPVAKKYTQREGIGLDSKMAFLTVHGFLHLLGYDHEKQDDKEAMFKLQDEILTELSYSL